MYDRTTAQSDFRFLEEPHEYYLGERLLWSITGILKDQHFIDPTWYSEESRRRGKHVHQAIHYLNKGTLNWGKLKDEYMGYVIGYERLLKEFEITPVIFEQPMLHPAKDLLFACTPDIIGFVKRSIPSIIELKTGPVRPWAAIQTAAQELCQRANESKPVRRRRWGVQLNADGTYQKPIEFKNWAYDEAVVRNLVFSVNSRESYGIKHKPKMEATNGND